MHEWYLLCVYVINCVYLLYDNSIIVNWPFQKKETMQSYRLGVFIWLGKNNITFNKASFPLRLLISSSIYKIKVWAKISRRLISIFYNIINVRSPLHVYFILPYKLLWRFTKIWLPTRSIYRCAMTIFPTLLYFDCYF